MKHYSFPRKARLKSTTAVERLFHSGRQARHNTPVDSCLCYPLRAVWTRHTQRHNGYEGSQVLLSVPKKKLHQAVDRVLARRRMREAWRLQQAPHTLPKCDVALIYVADRIESFDRINRAVTKILSSINSSVELPENDA